MPLIGTAKTRLDDLATQKTIAPAEAAWLRAIRRYADDEQSELIGQVLATYDAAVDAAKAHR